MNVHPQHLAHIRAMADLVRDDLGEDDDEAAFFDTLEGLTDFAEIMDRLVARMREDQDLADSADRAAADAKARAERFKRRIAATKKAMVLTLDATGKARMQRGPYTVSLQSGRLRTVVDDRDDIPTQLMRETVKVEPDLTAIGKQLDAGEAVPGARRVRGDDSVTVRWT